MQKSKILFLLICAIISKSIIASPVWTFTPLTPTQVTLTLLNPTAVISYRLTNQSRRVHSLVLQPAGQLTQLMNMPGDCQVVSTLAYKESCNLRVLVVGNLMEQNFNAGPIVCEFGTQGQCYRPEEKDIITVIVELSIKLSANMLEFASNETDKILTVTNTSTEKTAHDIQAEIIGPKARKVLSQDASDCKVVEPGQSCTIYFKRKSMDKFQLDEIKIKGKNTRNLKVKIKAEDDY